MTGKQNRVKSSILIVGLFLLISTIMMIPFYLKNELISGYDMQFHLNRINELYNHLLHGSWFSFGSVYSFNGVGTPTELVYPSLFIYPFAIIRLFIKNPIAATYMGIQLIIFLSMIISFITGMKFWNGNKTKSIIFSVMYSASAHMFQLLFVGFSFGEVTASIFLPLVVYGTYSIFFEKSKNWLYLVVGMTGTVYNHVLSVALFSFVVFIIIVVAAVVTDDFWRNCKYLIFAVGMTLLCSAFFLINFCTMMLNNHMNVTAVFDLESRAIQLGAIFDASLNNGGIGVVPIILIIFSTAVWKNIAKMIKVIGIIGLLLLIFGTSVFPWSVLQNTPFSVIQFPHRIFTIAVIFLTVFCTEIISINIVNKSMKYKECLTVVCICLMVITFTGSSYKFFNDTNTNANVNFTPSEAKYFDSTHYKVTEKTFNNLFAYNSGVGSTDYWLSESTAHLSYFANHKIKTDKAKIKYVRREIKSNYIIYKVYVNKKDNIDLPIINYSNTRAYVNKKLANKTSSYYGGIRVNVKKGINTIKIKFVAPQLFILSIIISMTGFILYVYIYIKKKKIKI
ncbi:hypothetical protein FC70_GL000715 [Paucilactobacillus oligofermentans DSM 15707 = LMG 22743]|uniref:YfhO family protein n=1 Tax=Paucilactobacillus oligofermentans DSM 15707 = LMG 22743 TaxID=1423778 RepID=A0A0R1RDS3_9LACO|nr:hypothetical protein [Paucilactobacillus oligofermentans]KRL55119.1 hypothetical protein FC70_GL000715 [Paucilactobacillus oligofermentans DSM 15707 = LMG 22743]CUS25893.1 Putative membrane protein [Paucilactobacillus oligofermentans DSM 15707 = LMG 22743]